MKLLAIAALASFVILGCAASVASKYGTTQEVDKFNNNRRHVTMSGGVIDADYLGMVANAAEFNPFVIRDSDNKILQVGVRFKFENNTTITNDNWLNINEGSTAIFLIDEGAARVELTALKGDMDYSVDAPQKTIHTTKYDQGIFSASPDQIKQISNAKKVEVRVSGSTSSIDFPRKPNNHLIENFLPNWKKFFESEIQPYL